MTKKIFRSIVLVAVCALLASLLLIMGCLYDYFTGLQSQALRGLFALGEGERALCFVSVGTVVSRKPVRARPVPAQYVGTLVPGRGVQPWPQQGE